MCGICGVWDLKAKKRNNLSDIRRMTEKLVHRGPDDMDCYCNENLALGFTRLSIIDLEGGMQPIFSEDKSIVLVCNGEIFNYIELRQYLEERNHQFSTNTDVEVLIHLYEDKGTDFLNELNGQFAFVIFDNKRQELFCARDHFGVIPFFYTYKDGLFIFASEIKAILEHQAVEKEVDLVGLDQVFSFPGLISPRTAVENIKSLENGHYLQVKKSHHIIDKEYWDVIYPQVGEIRNNGDEQYYAEHLADLIMQSVKFRLRSDVPVGFYISGGLDSSMVSAVAKKLTPNENRKSFSIDFEERELSESKYQRIMSEYIKSDHCEQLFRFNDISERLPRVIYHCECPLKESYNTASMALSEAVRQNNIKVVLTGEGADEFFAGYVGYRFDKIRQMQKPEVTPETQFEREIRHRLWGDENFFYEKNHYAFHKIKKELYSEAVNENFEGVDCLNHFVVNNERLKNRDFLHRRSYLDYKLRLADHLISDHGDRMAMANSVEARYPFLDKEIVEFAARIPVDLKLKDFEEKYILKRVAKTLIPEGILNREKFGFAAPGSPYLLKRNIEYIDDLLSFERIKRQGYFNPNTVEKLKKQYKQDNFVINVPFDSDLLIIVLTFGIFLEQFQLPDFV
jgi:asparagine synthase (glutamine-hydrolysing)